MFKMNNYSVCDFAHVHVYSLSGFNPGLYNYPSGIIQLLFVSDLARISSVYKYNVTVLNMHFKYALWMALEAKHLGHKS